MTITVGHGPLAANPQGRGNYRIESPEHRLLLEPYPQRLRAVVAGRVVLDTTRASVLHETGKQLVPYVPLEDFDADALQRTDTSTHCPYKGDASYWSVSVAGRTETDAVWAYEKPLEAADWLRGLAALKWSAADAWYVEDEVAFGPHLRDPYHRVDVYDSSREVTIRAAGQVVARTRRPRMLFETSLPVRIYVPRVDVDPSVLVPSEKVTQCPYKGQAAYFAVQADGSRIEDAAWTYETPLPEARKIAGDVCFVAEGIEVEVAAPGG